ncbi:MAG: response regulator [Desulfobacteraceae bacterium]|nr:response regulator [Desulfobacteraceae bacterium]
MIFFTEIPINHISHNAWFLLFLTIIGITAGYTIEYQSRMVFLKSALLEQIVNETKNKEDQHDKELFRINKSLGMEIRAHTEAESQLKESEEKYRNLVVSMPEGIFIVQEQKIVFLNPSMETLTGYNENQLLGSDADTLFIKDNSMSSEILEIVQDFVVKKDGNTIFIEKSFVEIVYNSKPALLFCVRDITEKINTTLDKNRLRKELEKAKKMEDFGILAGGVAHDLNNVLSGLVSTPDLLLLDLPKDSDLIEHIEMIKDSGRRASGIAEELLTLARGSTKNFEPIQFVYIIEDYLMSPEFEKLMKYYPNIEIIKEFDQNLPYINASDIHMRKIVMNIVSNAVEAAGKDKGEVVLKAGKVKFHNQRISGYEIVKNGNYIMFSVMNTGLGISKDDIDHIFEPFYSKKVLGRSGTGLGLSIVWSAVHDHNGYIHVSSIKGQTHFILYFPTIKKTDALIKSPQIYTLSDYSGNNEKILVVDDIEPQQKIAKNILKRLGYQVKVVSSGEDAIEYAKENKIDLVVLDMIMDPGIGGRQTYEQLVLIDPEIKAIITSGFSKTNDVKKAQALGAGRYIKKPYSLEKIGLAIKNELLDRETKNESINS